MRRTRVGLAGAVVALLLAGCGGAVGVRSEPPLGASVKALPSATRLDPLALVGSWQVAAVGEQAGAVLRLGDDLMIWRDCGTQEGAWRADDTGLFVAYAFGYSEACRSVVDKDSAWLGRVRGYRPDGAGFVLVDADRVAVAHLLPGGRPTPGPDVDPDLAKPPVLDDQIRGELASAAPLPAAATPATASTLLGEWRPVDGLGSGAPKPPALVFAADGTWHGSDGCNGLGGRWVSGAGGAVLAVSGPTTLIGCDGADVGGWLLKAGRAALDGDILVLVDAHGHETGRLRRSR